MPGLLPIYSLFAAKTPLDLNVFIMQSSHKRDNKSLSFLAEGSTAVHLADTGVSCVEEVASSPHESMIHDPLECEVRQAVLSIAEAGPPVTLLQIA